MRRRRLAILSILAAAVMASGCVTPVGYGHGPRYDRGWYGGRYYEPRRTVVVRPAPVIVRRPVIRYVEPHHRRHAKREWVKRHERERRERWERHDRGDRSDRRGWRHRGRGR